jgi:hypothetical protein
MATLTITAAATGFTPPAKVFTMTDSVMQLMIDAYQSDANVSINGTATRVQVLNYITELWRDQIKQKIRQFQTIPAVVPDPPVIS